MDKTYRPWNPNQQYLLPPSVQDWLPENDLVYFLLDTVNELDISAITQTYEQEKRGFPPFHPHMMVGFPAMIQISCTVILLRSVLV